MASLFFLSFLLHAKFLFSGSAIYKYGVGRRHALSLEAALVTPVTPRVIPNPRVRIVQDFIFLTFKRRSPVINFLDVEQNANLINK